MQTFSEKDTEVIKKATRKRLDVISLARDKEWLSEITADPDKFLSDMSKRGSLIPLGAGYYAIPKLGHTSVAYKEWQPLVDGRLSSKGNYYLAGLSALIEHRLTDISTKNVTVVVGYKNTLLDKNKVEIAGRKIEAVRSLRPEVFYPQSGIEKITQSRTQSYLRSDFNRTLVDCLWHPEICGPTEIWATAWGRAKGRKEFDSKKICEYAILLGPLVAQKVAVMLELLGEGGTAKELIPKSILRRDRLASLVSDGPSLDDNMSKNEYWRVVFNIPEDQIQGWLSYGK